MKYCPRCKREREDIYFEPPMRICLVCYAGVRENREIRSIEVLREKARRSRNVAKWGEKEHSSWVGESLQSNTSFQIRAQETRDILKDAKSNCHGCERLVSIDELEAVLVRGVGKTLCITCRQKLVEKNNE